MKKPRTRLAFRQSGDTFRSDIAGIRGVAVLLVVACHCGIPWCAGGFVGVDIFFVISGYLMTGLLAREYLLTSRIDFRAFFARRARRLLPACLLVLASTALAAALLLGPQEIEFTAHAALAGSIYMSNVFFDHASSDYFAAAVQRNPLLHIWSLGVEEQFYLVWPWLVIIAFRWRRMSPVWILGALAAGSFVCGVLATRDAPTFAFYELPARAWEFAVGGLLALATVEKPCARVRNWAVAGGVVGATMVLGTVFSVRGGNGFPGWVALIPVAGHASHTVRRTGGAGAWSQRGARHGTAAIPGCQIVFLVSLALAAHRVRLGAAPCRDGRAEDRGSDCLAHDGRNNLPLDRAPDPKK